MEDKLAIAVASLAAVSTIISIISLIMSVTDRRKANYEAQRVKLQIKYLNDCLIIKNIGESDANIINISFFDKEGLEISNESNVAKTIKKKLKGKYLASKESVVYITGIEEGTATMSACEEERILESGKIKFEYKEELKKNKIIKKELRIPIKDGSIKTTFLTAKDPTKQFFLNFNAIMKSLFE